MCQSRCVSEQGYSDDPRTSGACAPADLLIESVDMGVRVQRTLVWRLQAPPGGFAECYLDGVRPLGYQLFVLENGSTSLAETHDNLSDAFDRTTEVLRVMLELGWVDVTPGA